MFPFTYAVGGYFTYICIVFDLPYCPAYVIVHGEFLMIYRATRVLMIGLWYFVLRIILRLDGFTVLLRFESEFWKRVGHSCRDLTCMHIAKSFLNLEVYQVICGSFAGYGEYLLISVPTHVSFSWARLVRMCLHMSCLRLMFAL